MLLAAGAAYTVAGGHYPLANVRVADLWPLAAMAIVAQLVNTGVMTLFFLFDRRDVRSILKPAYVLSDFVFVPAGVLAAVLYNSGHPSAFVLFALVMLVFVLSFNSIGIAATAADRRGPMAKLFEPETETPETLAAVPPEDESERSKNLIGAIIQGAMDGLRLSAGICALIIAILGIVALLDKLLGVVSSWFGMSEPLSIVRILGWVFYPFAFLLGLQPSDVPLAARLLGERVILTEVFSYNHLSQLISTGQLTNPRTVVILTYALCGFAHVAAMAIFVGGTAALAPTRRDDLASLGLRALLAATLATLMTGCIAGIFSGGEGALLIRLS